jgi:hypothetical protein
MIEFNCWISISSTTDGEEFYSNKVIKEKGFH